MDQQPLYETTPNPTPAKPMKWHNFLIYFGTWAAAAIMVLNAVRFFTGTIEGDAYTVRQLYSLMPSLKGVHMVMGILCIGAAVLAILTRFALAGYKRNAISLLSGMYLCNALVNPLYCLMISIFCSVSLGDVFDSSIIGGFVVPIAMIFINRDYYGKRAELFVK